MSSHKKNQTNNKNMLTFRVKIDIINIYKEKKQNKAKRIFIFSWFLLNKRQEEEEEEERNETVRWK